MVRVASDVRFSAQRRNTPTNDTPLRRTDRRAIHVATEYKRNLIFHCSIQIHVLDNASRGRSCVCVCMCAKWCGEKNERDCLNGCGARKLLSTLTSSFYTLNFHWRWERTKNERTQKLYRHWSSRGSVRRVWEFAQRKQIRIKCLHSSELVSIFTFFGRGERIGERFNARRTHSLTQFEWIEDRARQTFQLGPIMISFVRITRCEFRWHRIYFYCCASWRPIVTALWMCGCQSHNGWQYSLLSFEICAHVTTHHHESIKRKEMTYARCARGACYLIAGKIEWKVADIPRRHSRFTPNATKGCMCTVQFVVCQWAMEKPSRNIVSRPAIGCTLEHSQCSKRSNNFPLNYLDIIRDATPWQTSKKTSSVQHHSWWWEKNDGSHTITQIHHGLYVLFLKHGIVVQAPLEQFKEIKHIEMDSIYRMYH